MSQEEFYDSWDAESRISSIKLYPTTINPKIYPTKTTNKNQSNNYQLRPINQKMDIILSPEWMHSVNSESSKKVMKPSWDLFWESTQTSDHKLQVPTPYYVCVMLVVLVALCPSETWPWTFENPQKRSVNHVSTLVGWLVISEFRRSFMMCVKRWSTF